MHHLEEICQLPRPDILGLWYRCSTVYRTAAVQKLSALQPGTQHLTWFSAARYTRRHRVGNIFSSIWYLVFFRGETPKRFLGLPCFRGMQPMPFLRSASCLPPIKYHPSTAAFWSIYDRWAPSTTMWQKPQVMGKNKVPILLGIRTARTCRVFCVLPCTVCWCEVWDRCQNAHTPFRTDWLFTTRILLLLLHLVI